MKSFHQLYLLHENPHMEEMNNNHSYNKITSLDSIKNKLIINKYKYDNFKNNIKAIEGVIGINFQKGSVGLLKVLKDDESYVIIDLEPNISICSIIFIDYDMLLDYWTIYYLDKKIYINSSGVVINPPKTIGYFELTGTITIC